MPDAPATKGKARSLPALAPNQPSLPASCSVNGGLKLELMPSCDWATANICLTNLRASSSSRSESSFLVKFQPSAIAERWGCEDWRKRPDVNGCETRQTYCDCRNASRPWHASHVATVGLPVCKNYLRLQQHDAKVSAHVSQEESTRQSCCAYGNSRSKSITSTCMRSTVQAVQCIGPR